VKTDMEGNPIGLDYNAVETVIELYNVATESRRYVFNQVIKCFYWSVDIMKQQKPEGV